MSNNLILVEKEAELLTFCSKQVHNSLLHSPNPVLIKNGAKHWNILKWNPLNLLEILNHDPIVSVRFYQKNLDTNYNQRLVPFENDCKHVQCKLSLFLDWLGLQLDDKSSHNNSLAKKYNPKQFWGYCDYVHFETLFDKDNCNSNNSSMTNDNDINSFINHHMNFSDFLCHGLSKNDSTINGNMKNGSNNYNQNESNCDEYEISCLPTLWIGSMGANSVCHYDSYGVNIVCQVFGKKRWMLWPPNMTDTLHPTRLPFEESTIWSKIDILKEYKNNKNSKLFTSCIDICLDKGDILVVPKHWWHFVESIFDVTISVNQWISNKKSDNFDRLNEYVSRYLLTSLEFVHGRCNDLKYLSKWLNRNEDLLDPQSCLNAIDALILNDTDQKENHSDTNNNVEKNNLNNQQSDLIDAIIESITDPQVINLITKKMAIKLQNNAKRNNEKDGKF